MAYATLGELKERLGIAAAETSEDELLGQLLEAASAVVDGACGVRFVASAAGTARVFTPLSARLAQVDPFQVVTAIKTDADGDGIFEVAWAGADYALDPPQGLPGLGSLRDTLVAVGSRRFPLRRASLEVTGTYGPPAPPAAAKEVTLLRSVRLYHRKDVPLGQGAAADALLSAGLDSDELALLRRAGLMRGERYGVTSDE